MHVRVPIHCPKVIRVLRRPDKRSAIRQSCFIYCRMATRASYPAYRSGVAVSYVCSGSLFRR
ncbi:hypothetical protein CCO33_21565 [Salmonella enterica subsp. enterica serovar Takoradi]|nr:hypothetical protein CCO33_21565 [Salmonella enterica subsp. enterica serovar Takoradi]